MSRPCDTEILNTTIHQVRPDSEHPAETQSRDAARSRASNVYLFCRLLVGALETNGTRRDTERYLGRHVTGTGSHSYGN